MVCEADHRATTSSSRSIADGNPCRTGTKNPAYRVVGEVVPVGAIHGLPYEMGT